MMRDTPRNQPIFSPLLPVRNPCLGRTFGGVYYKIQDDEFCRRIKMERHDP
ncbi:hypothetical protein Barb4_02113 [Bacteroidales bacterium Barb4]|nr:hypothetical protein Barb4_02113 [Bacteroidales bacterium Barb4]